MASLKKRGKRKIYHIKWYEHGKSHWKSTKTTNFRKADKKRIEKEHELAFASDPKSYPDALIDNFFTLFLSQSKTNNKPATYQRNAITLRTFKRLFPSLKKIQDINIVLLEEFKTKRLAEKVKPQTVNREIETLKALFTYAVKIGYLKESPAAKIRYLKIGQQIPKFLSEVQIRKFKKLPKDLWYMACFLALYTGMRPDEILWLTKDDINLNAGTIHITSKEEWSPKTYQIRTIPINDSLKAFLKRYLKEGKSNYIVSYETGERPDYQTFCKMTSKVMKRVNPSFTLYTMRHTFASHLSMAQVGLNAIKEILGHSSIETTMIYSHISPQYLRAKTVSKLPY